jgi:uncharacterized membrane protein HdeD (DUF308 family)
MRNVLKKAGPHLTVSGILSLCFGLLVFLWPGISLSALEWICGISLIVQGLFYVRAVCTHRQVVQRGTLLFLVGVIFIAGGLFAILYPDMTALLLVKIMGVTWFLAGVLQVLLALRLRREIPRENWLFMAGVISLVAGVFVVLQPDLGAVSLTWLIALYAVLFGMLIIGLGNATRNWWQYFDEDVFQ